MNHSDIWLRSQPIAHRGLHDDTIPENSAAAFLAAVKAGYAIELDVQLSKDGALIVFHDYNALRMTGKDALISEMTLSEIMTLRLLSPVKEPAPGHAQGGRLTNQRIPTLSEVLQLVDGKAPLLIEIKNEASPGLLEETLCDTLSRYNGAFAIQSFNPSSLGAVRKLLPEVPRGQLSSAYQDKKMFFLKKLALKNFWLNFISQPDFIAWNIKDLPSPQIAAFKSKGIPVLGWTVRTQADLKTAQKYCTNIIFETIRPTIPTKT